MDFDQNDKDSYSSPAQGPEGSPARPAEPIPGLRPGRPPTGRRGTGTGWRVFWGILLALSVLANVGLFLMLVGVVAVFATGQTRLYNEVVVREGPRANKIVLVNLVGIIRSDQAGNVYNQLKAASRDRNVKGLILRVNSPGGTISGSDQIYKDIQKYRQEKGKPVVALMQGVAASGGYYAAVACDKIVAEPTAVTGSIGVSMGYFVFQQLLENKLGIVPVFLTAGEKKDWPSSYKPPTEEQLRYLRERLLTPAYERFVEVVTEGRRQSLTPDEVRTLADGGIYSAGKAKEAKLIDDIGYLDDAIELVKSLAGLARAQVVEYRRPFSLTGFLTAQTENRLKIDRSTLHEFTTPQLLYLWNAY